MCYEPQPQRVRCSCGHASPFHRDAENPVLAENKEGACTQCDCPAYDGLPPIDPDWLFDNTLGEGETFDYVLSVHVEKEPGPAPKPESYYRDMLAAQVGGRTEVVLPFGRADVLTGTTVYEVEPASRWREGVAQALQYAAQVPQRGAVAFYGGDVTYAKVRAELAKLPAPGLDLWWLEGERFVCICTAA